MMSMTAVIGSGGFLARAIINNLPSESNLRLFGNVQSHMTYHYPDKPLNYQSLLDCEVIYYCAGAGIQPGNSDSAELIFGLNLYEPIRLTQQLKLLGYQGHLVSFGSYFESGVNTLRRPLSEQEVWTHTNEITTEYAVSKHLFTRYLGESGDNKKFTHTHAILTNVYGAGENPQRLIPYILQAVSQGNALNFTSGHQVRQFVNICDVAEVIIKLAQLKHNGIVNVTAPEQITVRDCITRVLNRFTELGYKTPAVSFNVAERSDTRFPFLALNTELLSTLLPEQKWKSVESTLSDYINHTK